LFEAYPQPKYEIIWDNPNTIPVWKNRSNINFIDPALNRNNNDYSNLEKYIADNKINLFHSPNNGLSIPSNKVCKYIMTVHDLLPVINKEMADSKFQKKFTTVFPESIKKVDKIIAVSEYIKKQLVKNFKIDDEKITVIYPGCPKQFSQIKDNSYREFLKERYNIEGEYILYAGSIHQRKNIELILKGFKRILKNTKNIHLVIAGSYEGKRYEYYKYLKNMCRQMGIENMVLFAGRVEYNDMPALYNGAVCAVNTSFHEGFPLTTIEAMACGTPAICLESNIFTEIAGNSCLYIKDDEDFEVAVMELLRDSRFRNEIIHKGFNQSRKYTWENHIKKLVNVYESVVYGD
jgi:glycosyltransferase involved in cell wall biosynthesis